MHLLSLHVFIKKNTYDGPQKKTNPFIQVRAARCSDLRTVSRPRVDFHLFRVLILDLYKWICLFIVLMYVDTYLCALTLALSLCLKSP